MSSDTNETGRDAEGVSAEPAAQEEAHSHAGRERAELVRRIARAVPEAGGQDTALDGLKLIRYDRPTGPLHVQQDTALWILAQGRKEVILAGQTLAHGPGECLVVSFDLPVVARVLEASPEAPCLGFVLALPPADMAATMTKHGLEKAGSGDGHTALVERGASVHPVTPPLLGAAARLVQLLDAPGDAGALAPLVLEEIRYRLLAGPHGALARQIARANRPSQTVARAIAWLKAHYAEPYELDTLTREVGASASALHRHFKAATAMTPLQYQKELRLREARTQMLSEGLGASAAARRVGYESPSQFSREYKRLFGQPPSRDVASLRAGVS